MKNTNIYPKPKPICRPGNRNIHCPHYRFCLDHAAKHFWEYWNCGHCPHKLSQESMAETAYLVDGSAPHYGLPSNIRGQLRDQFS